MLDHTDHTAPTRQLELDRTDQDSICPLDRSEADHELEWGSVIRSLFGIVRTRGFLAASVSPALPKAAPNPVRTARTFFGEKLLEISVGSFLAAEHGLRTALSFFRHKLLGIRVGSDLHNSRRKCEGRLGFLLLYRLITMQFFFFFFFFFYFLGFF